MPWIPNQPIKLSPVTVSGNLPTPPIPVIYLPPIIIHGHLPAQFPVPVPGARVPIHVPTTPSGPLRNTFDEERKRQEAERRRLADDARRQREEADRRKREEDARRQREEADRRKREEDARRRQEEENRSLQDRIEEDRRRHEEENRRLREQLEADRRRHEEDLRRIEADRRRQDEENRRLQDRIEEDRRRHEEENRRLREQQEADRQRRARIVDPPLPVIPEPEPKNPGGEKAFGLRYGVTIANELRYKKGSLTLGTNVTRFAEGLKLQGSEPEMLKLNPKHEEGSQKNAFRHTLWQAAITEKYGADIAREAGWAHESNPAALNGIADPSSLTFSNIDLADEAADLLNNKVGRQIGCDTSRPRRDMRDLAWGVLHEFYENGLWTAVAQADGTFKIAKTKLTDHQYGAAATRLSNFDEHGFSPEDLEKIR
jgi:hypothetical protein